MMSNLLRTLSILLVLVLPFGAVAQEPVTHLIQSQLFEVIEDGMLSNKRISLEIFAVKKGGVSHAQCRFTVITINNERKHIYLDTFAASTDDQSIRHLKIEEDALSFEMIPFSLAPDRPIRLVATRKGGTSNYKVSAVGLWMGLMEKSKLLQIEWKQVPSITLPYNTISR